MHHFSVCLPDEMDATEIVFLDHRNASAMQMHLMEITGTMARDSQRRKAELNMWHKLKKQDTGPKHGVRPANPNDCTDRRHAELHRRDVGRELSAVMTHLTATSLVDNLTPRAAPGDDTPDSFEDVSYDAAVLAKVRDLNHTAQRLVRLHAKWDKRVVALGGTALVAHQNAAQHFFGAARGLPEARKAAAAAARRVATVEVNTGTGIDDGLGAGVAPPDPESDGEPDDAWLRAAGRGDTSALLSLLPSPLLETTPLLSTEDTQQLFVAGEQLARTAVGFRQTKHPRLIAIFDGSVDVPDEASEEKALVEAKRAELRSRIAKRS